MSVTIVFKIWIFIIFDYYTIIRFGLFVKKFQKRSCNDNNQLNSFPLYARTCPRVLPK